MTNKLEIALEVLLYIAEVSEDEHVSQKAFDALKRIESVREIDVVRELRYRNDNQANTIGDLQIKLAAAKTRIAELEEGFNEAIMLIVESQEIARIALRMKNDSV